MTTIMEARSNRRLELIAQRGQTVGPGVLILYVFHLFDCFGHTTIFDIHVHDHNVGLTSSFLRITLWSLLLTFFTKKGDICQSCLMV